MYFGCPLKTGTLRRFQVLPFVPSSFPFLFAAAFYEILRGHFLVEYYDCDSGSSKLLFFFFFFAVIQICARERLCMFYFCTECKQSSICSLGRPLACRVTVLNLGVFFVPRACFTVLRSRQAGWLVQNLALRCLCQVCMCPWMRSVERLWSPACFGIYCKIHLQHCTLGKKEKKETINGFAETSVVLLVSVQLGWQ